MATALDLKLKIGDKVLLSRSVNRRVESDSLFAGYGTISKPIADTFWDAPEVEIIDISKKGQVKVRYENGGEIEISSVFNGFSRQRSRIQRVKDFFKWLYHSYKPIL